MPTKFARILIGWTLACAPVLAQGIITTMAGNGTCGFSGDGGPAISAAICGATGAATDSAGNLYFADRSNLRIRMIAPNGTITTIAGNGNYGSTGDGGPALNATLGWVTQLAVYTSVSATRVCFGDNAAHKVRCVDMGNHNIYGYGTGNSGTGGDGGNIANASFMTPEYMTWDSVGNLYISDSGANSVRRVTPDGTITTIAGPGPGYCCAPLGDGGPAIGADLYQPRGVAYSNGALYIADSGNLRIRRVDLTTGIITTIAGNGNPNDMGSADGGSALQAGINPYSIVADPTGNLFFSTGTVIREVDTAGIIHTIAGQYGVSGWGQDDVLSTQTAFSGTGVGWDPFAKRLVIGDDSRIRQIFFTPATTTTLTSSANPAVPGDTVTFQASISPADATGSVRFYKDGSLLGSAAVNGGVASFGWIAQFGTFGIRAVYGGDPTHNLSQSATLTQVGQNISTTTSLGSTPNPSMPGDNVTFTATVSPADSTGNVVFWVGGLGHQSPLVNGVSTYSTSTLPSGTSQVSANYSGDSRHLSSWSPVVNQVVKTATTTSLTSDVNPSASGATVTLTATVSPSAATGTVRFLNGSTAIGSATLAGGQARLSLTTLPVGQNSLTAVYDGDNAYAVSTSAALTEAVNPPSSTTTLSAAPAGSSTIGQTVTFTASVTPATATGTVQFLDGATVMGTATLNNGSAVFATSSLAVGDHSVTAKYLGDGSVSPSQSAAILQQVVKRATTTTLTSAPNPSTAGAAVTLTATVSPSSATGTVQFLNGATVLGSAALANGSAQIAVANLTVGSNSLTAVYSGDDTSAGSTSAAVVQTVGKANSTTTLTGPTSPLNVGQGATFTATVTPASATGTVQFLDGAQAIGTVAVSGGTAQFFTTALAAGSHSITAAYSGDGTLNPSTSAAVVVQVVQYATTTTLTTAPNPSVFTGQVSLNASVSTPEASGSMQFYDSAVLLGSATIVNGQAFLGVSSLTVGAHNLTAVYGGDARFAGSTSPVVRQMVAQAASTTTISAAPAGQSSQGQTVTFTATVSPAAATGSVQFRDGNATIGTVTLVNGVATFATSALKTGNHSITAAYLGDSNVGASESAKVTYKVRP